MATYKCIHCEWEVESKCVRQRNGFPVDEFSPVSTVRSILAVKFEPDPHRAGKVDLVARMSVWEDEPDLDKELARLRANLLRLSPIQVKQVTCKHKYEIKSGTCDFGCCKA